MAPMDAYSVTTVTKSDGQVSEEVSEDKNKNSRRRGSFYFWKTGGAIKG